MTEKLRITRVRRGRTKSGKVIAELRTANTRLEYPELRLFDLDALRQVGIDPNFLTEEDVYCQFFANYELAKKLTSDGNPYKDIVSLEAIDAPATTTSTDNSAVIGELRAIKALLLELAASSEESRSLLARLATLPPMPAFQYPHRIVGLCNSQAQAGLCHPLCLSVSPSDRWSV